MGQAHQPEVGPAELPGNTAQRCGNALALNDAVHLEIAHMIWFLERDHDLLICEVRREGDQYAIELAPSQGPPETRRYSTARDLVTHYLHATKTLKAQGWRPARNMEALG